MYEIFNPEIPGLEQPNPGISGLRKMSGIPVFGIGIPMHDVSCFVQICMPKRLSNASRPLEDGNILIFRQLGELYSKCYYFKCMPH
jgi:hypothetical protein